MGDIGDKFSPLAIAVGQTVPLPGNLAGQFNKAIMQHGHFIPRVHLRSLRRQRLDRMNTVLAVGCHQRGELTHRARYPEPGKPASQPAETGHQQQSPQQQAPQGFLPGARRQFIKGFTLQDNVEIAAQLAVLAQRRHAKHLLLIKAARIVAVHRPGAAGKKRLHRCQIDALALNMPRRRGVGQQLAVGRKQIQLYAGIEGHQPIKKRLQHPAINLPLSVQQRLAGGDLLRQPGGETLDHDIAVLRAAVQLDQTNGYGTEQQQ